MMSEDQININIRLAKRPDKIMKKLYNLAENSYPNGSPWTLGEFEKILNQRHVFTLLAMEGGEIRGFLSGAINPFEAEIYNIVTEKGYQNLGIATELINEMKHLTQLHGVETILLEVRESNLQAMSVYKMSGFYPIGKRRSYYKSPIEDALILKAAPLYEERRRVNENYVN